jgi:hypothetical protein
VDHDASVDDDIVQSFPAESSRSGNSVLFSFKEPLQFPSDQVAIPDNPDRVEDQFVRGAVEHFPDQVAIPDNPGRREPRFLLEQWREIEEMLEERDAIFSDYGVTESY